MKAFFAYLITSILTALVGILQEIKRENKIAKDIPDCDKKRLDRLRDKYSKRVHRK